MRCAESVILLFCWVCAVRVCGHFPQFVRSPPRPQEPVQGRNPSRLYLDRLSDYAQERQASIGGACPEKEREGRSRR